MSVRRAKKPCSSHFALSVSANIRWANMSNIALDAVFVGRKWGNCPPPKIDVMICTLNFTFGLMRFPSNHPKHTSCHKLVILWQYFPRVARPYSNEDLYAFNIFLVQILVSNYIEKK